MTQLPLPDSHRLAAVKGWLELQAFDDAAWELEFISPGLRDHPQILEVRWALAANAGHWQEALTISVSIVQLMPEQPEGWIYQGSALMELNRHADAYAVLVEGNKRFPEDEIFPYDLACVGCALGRDDEALDWMRKALALAGDEIRGRALEDSDLERIHTRLLNHDD